MDKISSFRRFHIALLIVFITYLPVKSIESSIVTNVKILKLEEIKGIELFPNDSLFQPYFSGSERIEKETRFWLKFTLNPLTQKGTHYLTCPITSVKKAVLFYEMNGKLVRQTTGYSININKRTIKCKTPILELPVSDKPLGCYLYLENSLEYWFPFFIGSSTNLLELEVKQVQVEMFFLGISVLAFFLGIVLWVFSKEKIYLFYILLTGVFIFLRMFDSRLLLYFTNDTLHFSNQRQLFTVYSLLGTITTIVLILYISSFIQLRNQNSRAYNGILVLCILKAAIWIIHFIFYDVNWGRSLESSNIDFIIILLVIFIILFSVKKHNTLKYLSLSSLIFFLFGINNTLEYEFFGLTPYQSHLTILNLEIIFFAMGIGYRYDFLKKEKNRADLIVINTLKESEKLKDEINKELEIKVAERTEKIEQMFRVLEKNNIKLEEEVKDLTTSKVLQNASNYEEFSKIFPSDDSCFLFLSNLKWSEKESYKCRKCKKKSYTISKNYSRRCLKCSFNESTTAFSLFHNVKFSIQKAFFITYTTVVNENNKSIDESAKELKLRKATYWSFKRKVQEILSFAKNQPKAKDGWTHIIAHSIKQEAKKLS